MQQISMRLLPLKPLSTVTCENCDLYLSRRLQRALLARYIDRMDTTEHLKSRIYKELLRLEEDCTHSGKAHFNASARWNRWNYVFGIPSVFLSAAAGTAFFKDY